VRILTALATDQLRLLRARRVPHRLLLRPQERGH
jgi:hypothetical protein